MAYSACVKQVLVRGLVSSLRARSTVRLDFNYVVTPMDPWTGCRNNRHAMQSSIDCSIKQ
eukprot:13828733-Alexandrium_andersonii.AAC.1